METSVEEPEMAANKPSEAGITTRSEDENQPYAKKLLNSMAELRREGHFCDIILKSEISQEEFMAHTLVLAAASKYICCHLQQTRTYNNGIPVCALPVSSSCMEKLLLYIYCGKVDEFADHHEGEDLLAVAEEWQMEDLIIKCKDIIASMFPAKMCKMTSESCVSIGVKTITHERNASDMLEDSIDSGNVKNEGDIVNSYANDSASCQMDFGHSSLIKKNSKRQICHKPKKFVGLAARCPAGIIQERNERPYMCRICKADFTDKESGMSHIGFEHQVAEEQRISFLKFPKRMPKTCPPKLYRCACEGCEFRGCTIWEVLFHRYKVHNIPVPENRKYKIHQCHICGALSKSKGHFELHMNTHTRAVHSLCDHCGKKYSSPNTLKKHLVSSHGIGKLRTFPCPHCNYVTKKIDHFKIHMSSHTGEKPYMCHICSYRCSSRSYLKVHLNSHLQQHQQTTGQSEVVLDSFDFTSFY